MAGKLKFAGIKRPVPALRPKGHLYSLAAENFLTELNALVQRRHTYVHALSCAPECRARPLRAKRGFHCAHAAAVMRTERSTTGGTVRAYVCVRMLFTEI